ncbi:sulfite exporter TauE/SafE family protein [Bradyrhizobium sp. LHD-71]|uniref:sulfite exporter TauE/SafE family protein n=1 Tax=Bradyrhizobium sp. LHD-71 TaxID=3072141 RepID=UPI00280D33B4|nr:sulfite exporter TauE/SafE family protein [Bradyrhizobium sp. LHD-71]MDQ8726945.1 sulfite exporter TauE/SafE family protein [Bradyrhizobium sp. LHD-71]
MTSLQLVLLVLAGFGAGMVNAVAGGGSFFTFAALVFSGLPTLDANATSAAALTPANFASVVGYRAEVRKHFAEMLPFMVLGMIGAAVGAWLLIAIGDAGFRPTVPWLLLAATVLFAASSQINRLIAPFAASSTKATRWLAFLLIGIVTVYGGFFGAGMGIMMLAALTIIESGNFHKSNAIKNVVALLVQVVSSALLIAGGLVHWPHALITTAASIAGGYLGVSVARRVPERIIRAVVVTVGAMLTLVFFLR